MLSSEPDFEELLRCVFDVSESDAAVYRHLLEEPGSTTDEIADALGLDRSNVNRKLNALRDQGLISRNRALLGGGGYEYRYEPTSIEDTTALMHRTLDEWAAFMHDQIDAVEESLDAAEGTAGER